MTVVHLSLCLIFAFSYPHFSSSMSAFSHMQCTIFVCQTQAHRTHFCSDIDSWTNNNTNSNNVCTHRFLVKKLNVINRKVRNTHWPNRFAYRVFVEKPLPSLSVRRHSFTHSAYGWYRKKICFNENECTTNQPNNMVPTKP